MPRKSAASEAARLLSKLGARKGGLASAAALTKEQRKERGRAAVAERWKGHKKTPIDQASVLARLKGAEPVQFKIAPGAGGQRRRMAIARLAGAGRVLVVDLGTDTVTITLAVK